MHQLAYTPYRAKLNQSGSAVRCVLSRFDRGEREADKYHDICRMLGNQPNKTAVMEDIREAMASVGPLRMACPLKKFCLTAFLLLQSLPSGQGNGRRFHAIKRKLIEAGYVEEVWANDYLNVLRDDCTSNTADLSRSTVHDHGR